MTEKKPPIIRMNGKKTKTSRNDDMKKNGMIHDEHASTLEESDKNERIPTFDRNHSIDENDRKYAAKIKRLQNVKPIIVAAVSAVVIGICLGIIMLNMFDGKGDGGNSEIGYTTTSNTDKNKQNSEQTLSSATLDPIHAFVLQAGVFSTEANASKWSKKYQKAGFPTTIWQRDDQFFLLAGIAETEEQADSLKANFADFDIYVKEWNTKETEKQFTQSGNEWILSFTDLWHESLKAISAHETVSAEAWQKLLDGYPKQAEKLSPFVEQLSDSYKKFAETSAANEQIFLIEQWRQFEMLVLN
ncbi:SPOR domain-containing protein [Virgibacillus sp. FSP13]